MNATMRTNARFNSKMTRQLSMDMCSRPIVRRGGGMCIRVGSIKFREDPIERIDLVDLFHLWQEVAV